jgi:hypothetical protein
MVMMITNKSKNALPTVRYTVPIDVDALPNLGVLGCLHIIAYLCVPVVYRLYACLLTHSTLD